MASLLRLMARLVRSHRLPVVLESVRRVLVVDLNFLGDMLLSSPVYRALKENLPDARVDALVYRFAEPALRANPFVDEIHAVPPRSFLRQIVTAVAHRQKKYDLVLQLNTSLKTNLLLWLTGGKYRLGYDYANRGCFNNLRVPIATRTARTKRRTDECVELLEQAFHWQIRNREMIFTVNEADRERVRAMLQSDGIHPGDVLVGIHAHCRQGKKEREWSRFASLASLLIERRGAKIVLTGSPEDMPDVRALAAQIRPREMVVPVAGRLSLNELAALMTQLSAFVTVNTGPMHIALATRVPTVAVIGGTPAKIVYPQNDPIFKFAEDPALRSWDPTVLHARYTPALDSIGVEEVLKKVEELLDQRIAGRDEEAQAALREK